LSSEKNGVDMSEEENAKEASEKEGGLEEHGKGEEEPAGSCPIVKGNLKVTHQDTIEEIKDMHQVQKRGRGRPQKVNVDGQRIIRRPVPQVQGGEKQSSPSKEGGNMEQEE
jgi:hypothetical protein